MPDHKCEFYGTDSAGLPICKIPITEVSMLLELTDDEISKALEFSDDKIKRYLANPGTMRKYRDVINKINVIKKHHASGYLNMFKECIKQGYLNVEESGLIIGDDANNLLNFEVYATCEKEQALNQ